MLLTKIREGFRGMAFWKLASTQCGVKSRWNRVAIHRA
jgi:hypothetical protein